MIEAIAIAQAILGIAFLIYLPGHFITDIFFSKRTTVEKIFISIILSLMVGLSIGIFFGYDTTTKSFGGFTQENIWIAEIIVTSFLAISATSIRIFRTKYQEQRTNRKRRKIRITDKRRKVL